MSSACHCSLSHQSLLGCARSLRLSLFCFSVLFCGLLSSKLRSHVRGLRPRGFDVLRYELREASCCLVSYIVDFCLRRRRWGGRCLRVPGKRHARDSESRRMRRLCLCHCVVLDSLQCRRSNCKKTFIGIWYSACLFLFEVVRLFCGLPRSVV